MVSESGKVVRKRDRKVVANAITPDGYPKVKLRLGVNSRVSRLVHRLVAIEFVAGYKLGLDVNHIDGDKMNAHCSNLEWVTRRENILHAYRTGLKSNRGDAHPCRKLREVDIPQIRTLKFQGVPTSEIAAMYDVSYHTIWKTIKNKNWSHV